MQYKSIKGINGWGQLGILLAFVGVGLIFAGAVQMYFGYKALGPNSLPFSKLGEAMLTAMMKPENAIYMQLSQIFGTFFLLFVPSVAYVLICHKKISWAGVNKYFSLQQIVLAFLIILCTTFFAGPFADVSKAILAHFPSIDVLAKKLENIYNDAVASMGGISTWQQFIMGTFIIAFLPALFEELFFRGVLQNFLVKWTKKPMLAIIITSIIFSLIHNSYYLFISRFILGYVLGLLFYKSKNIWVNTFAHFMNNFLALIQMFYLSTTKNSKIDINDMDAKMPMWSMFITLAILVFLFYWFDKKSEANKEKIELTESIKLSSNSPFDDWAV